MATFEIPQDSKLTLSLLDSIKPESWLQTDSWAFGTKLMIRDEADKARMLAAFETASQFTFRDRKTVKEYLMWKKAQASSTPPTMAIDAAVAAGKQIIYAPTHAVIHDTIATKVPACRVPLEETMLKKMPDKGHTVRQGSDILAATLGAMTRWTGESVVFSMPVDTIMKYGFVHAKPDGIRTLLASIPPANTENGVRGRAWAYHLMAIFQTMPTSHYAELMSNYCEAMFGLPQPKQNVALHTAFKDNVELYICNSRYYYKLVYKNPNVLGGFRKSYTINDNYEHMVAQVVDFAAGRQGDASGIAMLSQSTASWGLVSKEQAELEQTVSLIIGMGEERTVLTGYTQIELDRIRASVAKWAPKILVLELVSQWDQIKKNQTNDPGNSLHIIRGKTLLDTSLTVTKTGTIRQYSAEQAKSKLWDHVHTAVSHSKHVIYFGAGFPPADTKVNVFMAGNAWASVFFFSQREQIRRATFSVEDGVRMAAHLPLAISDVYAAVMRGMNNTVASWIVPPVNNKVMFSGLMVSIAKPEKAYVLYDPDGDTYQVEYYNDIEATVTDPGVPDEPRKDEEKVAAKPNQRKPKEEEGVYIPVAETDDNL
jgi:hypothetical protein